MTNIHSLLEQINLDESVETLDKVNIEDIEFSRGTYLAKVYDSEKEESFWPFLHLSDETQLQDCFCSCDNEDEEEEYCIHICKAIQFISTPSTTLHMTFYSSLWFTLTYIYIVG